MKARPSIAALLLLVPGVALAQAQQPPGTGPGSQYNTAPAASTQPGSQYNTAPAAGGSQYNTGGAGGTSHTLDRSEKEDSGRGFELFYAHVDANFSYANLAAFSGASKSGLGTRDALGAAFGVSAGVRVLLFTFGLRGRLHTLSNFNLWQANAVVGLHLPIRSLDLYGEVFGGYSAANAFGEGTLAEAIRQPATREGVAAMGGNVGLGFGADYYLNQYFSLGGGVTAESLLLTRSKLGAAPSDSAEVASHPLFSDSAALAGIGITAGLRVGLHLGL